MHLGWHAITRGLGVAVLIAGCAAPTPPSTPLESAAPSLPPAAELVFRLERLQGIGALLPTVSVYADGRILSTDPASGIVLERVLSPGGQASVVAEVEATGLFEQSRDYWFEARPGVDVPAMELPVDHFRLWREGGVITVTSTPLIDLRWMLPSSEREALAGLADRLETLDWLDANAWVAVNPEPYRAPVFAVFSGVQLGVSNPESGFDVSTVPWPIRPGADGIGNPFRPANGEDSAMDHCLVVSRELAIRIHAALMAGGVPDMPPMDSPYVSVYLPWRDRDGELQLQMRFLYPEETATCVGKSLPPTIGP